MVCTISFRRASFLLGAICCTCLFVGSRSPGGAAAGATRPTLDEDGMLIVDGKRVFVFGCYWNPGTSDGLEQLRKAGFNLVRGGADRAALDEIARHDLMAWVPLGANVIAPGAEADQRKLESLARPLLDHPALAVWEVPDEALWNVWYSRLQRLAKEREKLRTICNEQEKAGRETRPVRDLMVRESQLRARADWEAAEAVDRQIRELLGAPAQDADMQLSRAPQAAEELRTRLLRGYRVLHQLDGRPIWMNYAPRNTMEDMRRYAEAADIVGCDIYPVPVRHSTGHSDLANRQLSCVGDYTDRFQKAGGERPVWMVLQGFGWRDIHEQPDDAPQDQGRRPTGSESRFMLYDAIVHGARGVLYWGCQYAQTPPGFWSELCAAVGEAAALEKVWAARDAEAQPKTSHLPTMGSVNRAPQAIAKQVGDKQYLLVVNEHGEGLGVRIQGLEQPDGCRASLVGDPEGCELKGDRVQGGSLLLHMPAYSAAVLLLQPR